MSSPILSSPTIRLHLGAHKTATTYLQDTLALNRAASAAAGTAYWTRERFRPSAQGMISAAKAQRQSGLRKLDPRHAKRQTRAVGNLKNFFPANYNVTISEENFLGEASDWDEAHTYPYAAQYLELLKSALPDRPVEIFLALRSYAGFSSSLYGEALRHGAFMEIAPFKRKTASMAGTWPRILETIQTVFPKAKIWVWAYEDFGRLEGEIMCRLSGLAKEAIQKPAQTDVLPSASSQAITQFVSEARDLNWIDRQLRMLALQAEHPQSGKATRFSLWSDIEAAKLNDEYTSDLAQIKAQGLGEFIS